MRTYSIYVVECLCGQWLRNHLPRMTCQECGRNIEIQNWGKFTSYKKEENRRTSATRGRVGVLAGAR